MELELFAFVFYVKKLSPYLFGKLFTVRIDHKNLVYLAKSTVQKLVRWRVLLSEFRFQIEHIPGSQNVVADGLTRIFHVDYEKLPEKIKYCFKEDSTQRIFRMEEKEVEDANPGDSDEEGNEIVASRVQDDDSEVSLEEKQAIFEQSQNSVIGHLGVYRTYKALKLRGHNWKGMREDLKNYISGRIICQKIKWQRPADWEDLVDHHLYSVTLLRELSIVSLSPLPEDEFGMRYIIFIVNNFSKFVGLYPAKNTSTLEFVKAFLS